MLLALSILMRTAHLIAGAVWVGGSVIYLAVIIPGLRLGSASSQTSAAIAALFRRVVNICIGVELLTGVYLIFDRLSTVSVGTAYIAVLVVKIAAALAMIALALYQAQEARRPAKYRGRFWRQVPRWILGLGLLTFFLGATLVGLFDTALLR
ncbi:MAG: hypothetical protein OJF49_000159 [Ktedonobacterales bacterium]|jgi:putative copper export protein|nr:MAG: hypothetical protein OJF49_000159 [Ktedonobacterales bacterium]